MEDGGSIVEICILLRNHISLLLSDVRRAMASIRNDTVELRRLPSELASLHLTIGAIQSSFGRSPSISSTLRTNLEGVIAGCDHVVQEMRDVLSEDPASLSNGGSSAMKRLLPGLEAHISAIQIALELLLVTTTEQRPSPQTLHSEAGQSSHQPQTTDQVFLMLREIRALQFQVAQLTQAPNFSGVPLQRFLEDASEYADSAYQDIDGNSITLGTTREDDAESDGDDFRSARESFMDPSRPTSPPNPEANSDFELLPVDTASPPHILTPNPTHLHPITPAALLPSASSLSAHSSWTYASIRLRISNRLYSFRTASDTTRNIISSITFLDPAIRAVRLARQQAVLPLSSDQRAWIDSQVVFAEESMERAAALVEPARVDLQTRGGVRFARKVRFILRDSPQIQTCFEQLSAAGAGLSAAANLLYGTHMVGDGDGYSISSMDIPAPPYSLSLRGEYY